MGFSLAKMDGFSCSRSCSTAPEKDLLAFVPVETANWLQRVVPAESAKVVVMAALNPAGCTTFAPLPVQTKPLRYTQCTQSADAVLSWGEFGRRS